MEFAIEAKEKSVHPPVRIRPKGKKKPAQTHRTSPHLRRYTPLTGELQVFPVARFSDILHGSYRTILSAISRFIAYLHKCMA